MVVVPKTIRKRNRRMVPRVRTEPMITPAMAIPLPSWLRFLIWERAMMPRTIPTGAERPIRRPPREQMREAVARPFVPGEPV